MSQSDRNSDVPDLGDGDGDCPADRHRAVKDGDETIIYDRTNGNAWVSSEAAIELEGVQ
jgi:hypothetical protein